MEFSDDLMRSDHLPAAQFQAPHQGDGCDGERGNQCRPEAVNAHIETVGEQVARQQAAAPESGGVDEHRHLGDFIAAQGVGRDTLGEVCRLEQAGKQQDGGGDA